MMNKQEFDLLKESLRKLFVTNNWNTMQYYYIYEKIIKYMYEDYFKLAPKHKPSSTRIICTLCENKSARFRISTQDYRCEKCKGVFK